MAFQGGEKKPRNMVSSSEYCYSDISSNNPNLQSHLVNNHLQGFEPNPDIFNLTTGMEMIGFFGGKTTATGGGGASSSKTIDDSSTVDYYQDHGHHHHHQFNNSEVWVDHSRSLLLVDDVFPCEGNEINRPSQGLSLSLSSTNPPTIGLQSFELRQQQQQDDGYFGKSVIQDGFLGKFTNLQQHGHQFQMRHSKYLGPAQELLNELCNLGITKQQTETKSNVLKPHKNSQWNEENPSTSSSKNKSPLCTLELLELQRRKTQLLSMLEEVDRRYRHYCDQMKAVVSSFEAVAGDGAATVYSALASKAMSRHFRCLRDGIVGQIKGTKKAVGEKDTAVAPGTTRGETPRLRILDQTLRQQKAFQQMTVMETHPWRPQRGLPERSVSVLRAWLFEHFLHPYPSDVDKHILARQTGLSRSQVANWFINARVRLWKPMVEEMYLEETKEQDNLIMTSSEDNNIGRPNQNPQTTHPQDQKPTPDQLVRIDSECLSSIINHPEKNNNDMTKQSANKSLQNQSHHGFGRVDDAFGAMELDFSAYNDHGGGSGGGVTLTLGLQQHGGGGGPGGVSLAFSPASQNSLFYAGRDHMEECQQVQYSLLESDHHQGQNLPYRNLMGAQLLHDLAG